MSPRKPDVFEEFVGQQHEENRLLISTATIFVHPLFFPQKRQIICIMLVISFGENP